MALVILNKLIQKDREKLSFIADHSLVIFLTGLIGARFVFIVYNAKTFIARLNWASFFEIFYIWDKGLSFWGGLLGITFALLYYCKKNRQNILEWLDILTISVLTGLIFANIGTFLDGRNYGNETSLPWGVMIENSRFAVPIHPTQIYAAIYTLALSIVLFCLYKNVVGKTAGNIALIGSASYAFLRFLEEFLRGDESNYFLGLREAQIYCLLALVGIFILSCKRFIKKPLKN